MWLKLVNRHLLVFFGCDMHSTALGSTKNSAVYGLYISNLIHAINIVVFRSAKYWRINCIKITGNYCRILKFWIVMVSTSSRKKGSHMIGRNGKSKTYW
ncbi:hypothetical protein BC833DRAFT_168032 [Globomyces pollinis-pini]|nr:hypothetical protein BC833DRAFT_168032 [Globomyces pollinis-pini]